MALCPAPATDGLVDGLVTSVDCNIRTLVHDGYRELVGPGTTFAAAFTTMLTIYIALIGYRLLLGRGGLRLNALPAMALKVGLIMAFVTSWAAYQTVIFSFLFDGPREILSALLRPVAGAEGDVYAGVEHAYATLASAAGVYGGQANPAANILQGGPMLGAGVLWLSAMGVLLIIVGVILAAKIVLGFLLAVGPIFVALALFDATRGLFDGWLRATLAFAITPLAANVFGLAMLLMLSPFLATLADNAALNVFDMGPIVTIALIVMVFAVVMVMALKSVATIAGGFASPRRRDAVQDGPSVDAQPAGATVRLSPASSDYTARTDIVSAEGAFRRTEIVREQVSADAPAERLGQAYRRLSRPTLRTKPA